MKITMFNVDNTLRCSGQYTHYTVVFSESYPEPKGLGNLLKVDGD